MASEVELVNVALTLLGEGRITSLDDDIKSAREAKALFTVNRDALLTSYTWSFAKARTQLSALVSTPVSEFNYQYQLPSDCLRVVKVGDYYMGLDVTDYRGASTKEFMIEGRLILTNLGAPLNLQYIARVVDTAQWQSTFARAFAAQMAMDLAEPLTQSDTKRDRAERAYARAISDAVRSNAIELPPERLPDDDWIMSRL